VNYSAIDPGGSVTATSDAVRVVRVERKACVVSTSDGLVTLPTLCSVTVGDWAVVNSSGQVAEVLPRQTEIRRMSTGGQAAEQVLAANVDVVAVCTPLEADTRPARIERFLAIAWSSGGQPMLIATKSDLCPPHDVALALAQLADLAPGVEVVPVTVTDPVSIESIRAAVVPDRTLAVLGASGVGKSSLINALLGEEALATSEVRSDGKGRHTTAWRELIEIPGGGSLIDTPGLRAVGLHDAQDGVDAVFAEIGEFAERCRFNDCQHDGEPGCAVQQAIADGLLDEARLHRLRKLEREMDYQARRFDPRAQAEHTKQWLAHVRGNRKARP
jgi:ribosome biogenesis GTPase